MAILSKEDILNIQDIRRELVEVPEWGGEVWVKGLSGADRDKLESSMIEMRGKDKKINMANVRARLASMAICDENGERMFSEKDIQVLGQKSSVALQRVFDAAQRLSGIGRQQIEELTEAMQDDPLDGSPSA